MNKYVWQDLHDGNQHTFGLHWTAEFMDYYYDGRRVRRVDTASAIPHVPQYLLISGGIFGNSWVDGSVRNDNWPASMYVDHVRAWTNC